MAQGTGSLEEVTWVPRDPRSLERVGGGQEGTGDLGGIRRASGHRGHLKG